MNIREEIQPWIVSAIKENGGRATITQVARHIWQRHEHELRSSDEIFFNWQYEMRWGTRNLRRSGDMKPADPAEKGIWATAR